MKKITETQEILGNMEDLISKMSSEIELLRNIVHRYHAQHGPEVAGGEMSPGHNLSFSLSARNGVAECLIFDRDKHGLESNYQKIQKQLEWLNH